jgi:hypothetical protein
MPVVATQLTDNFDAPSTLRSRRTTSSAAATVFLPSSAPAYNAAISASADILMVVCASLG